MLTGALAGALLVVHVDLVVPLGVAAVLLAASAIAAHQALGRHPRLGLTRSLTTACPLVDAATVH
jgi:hypothetical protein